MAFRQRYGWIGFMLVITTTALALLLSNAPVDESLLNRLNGVTLTHIELIYAVLMIGLCIALPFTPRLYAFLQRFQIGILILSAVTCFLIIRLLEANQEHRLFNSPFSVWVIIIHAISICGILVWTSLHPTWSEARFHKLIVISLAGILLILIALYIASLGEFMSLDMPDEPWLASMATNYAQNGDFSSSFIGSPYGSPDPVLSRYYFLMALIVKVIGSSLPALRLLSLLLGLCTFGIVAYILWTEASLTTPQRLMGVIGLLCMSVFLRMSHNIRSDIGLALYGAIILLGLLRYFANQTHPWKWLLGMGAVLYIRLEAIPFAAVLLGVVVGAALVLNGLQEKGWRVTVKNTAIYALGCLMAFVIFAATHFLPNIPSAIAGFQKFNAFYSRSHTIGLIRNPLPQLINYHIRFSLILSPIEILVAISVVGLLWWKGGKSERWILAVFGLTACLILVFTDVAYGYWALFTPLLAYATAKALSSKKLIVLGLVVFIPALIAPPVYDMSEAILSRDNQTRLEAADQLTTLFPEHITMIADDLFWFTLHPNRRVIGIAGIRVYAGTNHIDLKQSISDLNVEALLCDEDDKVCQRLAETGLFGNAQPMPVGDKTYLIYWRL